MERRLDTDQVETVSAAPSSPGPSPSLVPDLLGVLWVAAAGIAMLVPALAHGSHLGPFDLLSKRGLTKQPGVLIHNTYVGDQISAIIPWTNLAWTQVHHGQLPLWNPLSGVGMPLAFNWQSAPFGLPALVGYLAPLQYAYTVGVVVTVLIAGTGAYFLGRVLHLGVLGCAMAGTVFELSGPFVGWLGWPHASVFAWAGWLFGAALLIVRGGRRARSVAFFAVIFAFAVFAGQPEILVVLLFALFMFLVVVLASLALRGGVVSIYRPIVDLALASAAGAALAAPLALPGLKLASVSVHSKTVAVLPLGVHFLGYFIFQGFDGLPIAGSRTFGPFGGFYIAAYVGVIALVLAAVAIVVRHRAEVVALAVVALVTGGIAFALVSGFTLSLVGRIPIIGTMPERSLLPVAFAVAILSGIGIDVLVRAERERGWRWTGVGFAVFAVALVVLYVDSVGNLPGAEDEIRARSFVWPVIEVVVGMAAASAVVMLTRPGRRVVAAIPKDQPARGRFHLSASKWAGLVLLTCETAFLVAAGAPLWSSSPNYFAPTPADSALQRTVGSSLVGVGQGKHLCTGLGIRPNVNVVFGVHELMVYDPMLPKAYFTSFTALTGEPPGFSIFNSYCPALTSASVARVYGVSYILTSTKSPGPVGTRLVSRIGDEDLYSVPASYPATLTPQLPGGKPPNVYALGRPVDVIHPNSASWKLTTTSRTSQELRLRLADVDGWHASIDGRPLALQPYAGIMLQAEIPAGVHVIELHYWPDSFDVGLVLAVCGVIGLAAAVIIEEFKRRRNATPTAGSSDPRAAGY